MLFLLSTVLVVSVVHEQIMRKYILKHRSGDPNCQHLVIELSRKIRDTVGEKCWSTCQRYYSLYQTRVQVNSFQARAFATAAIPMQNYQGTSQLASAVPITFLFPTITKL